MRSGQANIRLFTTRSSTPFRLKLDWKEPEEIENYRDNVLPRGAYHIAPRTNWKGYLRLSLVSRPIALYPASSLSEKVSFNR
jgi:hypothetical protein